ncbi:MAG: Uma2 family endonuclease [Thiocapsa sp.]|uniref:Uma2 family endonuclease n=1 Tax=Thiocapsa sp. TaxID=2024551 RepID=UPI001BCD252B|nr:Uma2 family endonuclease [Thiocapsa sp.]QVL48758.1 MAG: Uma2 family endonuclease [Thiocapsa sp.]
MQTQLTPEYRFEDYLAVERESIDVKHEYVAGQVFAMTGGSYEHSLIAANVTRRLGNHLDGGPCTVLTSDMRIRIETADVCAYPDVSVICDAPVFHDERRDVLTNPVLIAEVLSPSTEAYDRGGKFALYRRLPSLRHYLLIAQDQVAVDVFTRQPDGRWLLDAYADPQAEILLEALDCRLSVRELYDRVVFGSRQEGGTQA